MNIVIYSKDDCSYCMVTKMLLSNKSIPFTELRLGQDFTRETLLEMFPEVKTYPVIVIDGFNIGGYSQLKERLELNEKENRKFLTEGV